MSKFKLKPYIPLEGEVQKSILNYLSRHPLVAWAARFNSGAFVSNYKGRKSFTRFNTLDGCSDILGMLKPYSIGDDLMQFTRGGIFLAVEVKRPGWKEPKGKRELAQAAFHTLVNDNGGLAFFATSIEEVEQRLTAWAMQS